MRQNFAAWRFTLSARYRKQKTLCKKSYAAVDADAQLAELFARERAFEAAAQRPVPADNPDFAARIIAAAYTHIPVVSAKAQLAEAIKNFMLSFPIPRPAYTLASVIALGFVLGWASQPATTTEQDSSNFFYDMSEMI
ncbi:MAG: hypothetical protein SFX19_07015 [Alphaproteobacteria bacterium]|nr:hypothetical protein [Alphaproteobacteria bacterium]